MKLLESEFTGGREVKGFSFKKIKENDYVYMYEVTAKYDMGCPKTVPHYEVFERKVAKETKAKIGGVEITFPEQEKYPTQLNFGDWAFCISTYERAIAKFDKLTERCKAKQMLNK